MPKRAAYFVILSLLVLSIARAAEPDAAGIEFFESKIRPLLVEQCYKCHSHEAPKLKGKLYVDSLEGLIAGGETGPAIVPGDPAKSLLIEAVSYKNTELLMPPKTRLSEAQVAALTEWIKRGAPWPKSTTAPKSTANTPKGIPADIDAAEFEKRRQQWSFQPVKLVPPPAVKNAAWAKGPIDSYILAKLEEKSLAPAAPAEKRTLIRRAYFDLIGLPPTPEQVDAYLKDTSPDAFAKVVDGLLASPHFGERWGRHWLDLVRYGESRGHEFDHPVPNAHEYRDYVIRALNADVPYNQFVREHIAGDLLPAPRLDAKGANESIVATGFWFLGEAVHSPVDIRQDEADRFDNMVDVTCKTFLGLTVACARCHDHKFDPIYAKDYYALFGFLQSSNYRLAPFDTMEHNRAVAQELWKLRAESAPKLAGELAASMRPRVDQLGAYLLAAREALKTPPELGAGSGDWSVARTSGWKWDGSADGAFMKTENAKAPALSKKFPLKQNCVAVRFAPNAKGRGAVKILVDGKVVAEGRGKSQRSPMLMDVRAFNGKEAQIQMSDAEGSVEEILFTNSMDHSRGTPLLRGKSFSAEYQKKIAEIAKTRNLDAALLADWTAYLISAADNPRDPLNAWAELAQSGKPADEQAVKAATQPLIAAARQADASASDALKGAEIIVDYSSMKPEDWQPDGVSYGPGPVKAGEILFGRDAAHPVEGIAEIAAAEFDEVWNVVKPAGGVGIDAVGLGYARAGRTLCTRRFTISTGRVYVLLRGTGHVYAAVDRHSIVAGPLHGNLIRKFESKGGSYEWHSLDLTAYKEHRTHLEFSAESSDFAVARVVQSDHTPPLPVVSSAVLANAFASSSTEESLAAAYQKTFGDVLSRMQNNQSTADDASLANWLIAHGDLLGGGAGEMGKKFVAAQSAVLAKIKTETHLSMAMMDSSGEDEYVMKRGSWKNRGENAQRGLLEVIAGKNQPPVKSGSGRLELADRMVDPANPFITRVMVNRLWHHLFGRGIVPSVDNFGMLGQRDAPVHKDLLDYLATDFVKQGWSVKKMIRELMLSSTYQMASVSNGAADELDPDNQLLHRMPIRRLEGEVIRDTILSVSGRLDQTMYGRSIPIFLDDFMQGRGRPGSGPPDGNGRRSIYLSITRNFLSPMMLAFDMPIPFNTMGRRAVSNVPAQALILMNDPMVVQQAQVWAKRVLAEKNLTPEQRIEKMYLAAFARPPAENETAAALAFIDKQAQELGVDTAKRREDERAWADLAHVLMNYKEFIFVN
jgi:hypothetical protein